MNSARSDRYHHLVSDEDDETNDDESSLEIRRFSSWSNRFSKVSVVGFKMSKVFCSSKNDLYNTFISTCSCASVYIETITDYLVSCNLLCRCTAARNIWPRRPILVSHLTEVTVKNMKTVRMGERATHPETCTDRAAWEPRIRGDSRDIDHGVLEQFLFL